MLTPQSGKIQYKIHLLATFCELQPNQHVLTCILKNLRFQPALTHTRTHTPLYVIREGQFSPRGNILLQHKKKKIYDRLPL